MLASEKIANAFLAIVEEAEKLQKLGLSAEQESGVKTIISIARHQSDIRGANSGSCKATHSSCRRE